MKRIWMQATLALAAAVAMGSAIAAERVHVFNADSFRQIVAAHKGTPFVIVVWSLDCDYCKPSFKALAEAQRRHKLAVVTIATDRADDPEAVRAIVRKIGETGLSDETWASGDMPVEQLRYVIDPKWRGEMPRSYWGDQRGIVASHSGVITKELIAKLSGDLRSP
jgi:hypothetical protein